VIADEKTEIGSQKSEQPRPPETSIQGPAPAEPPPVQHPSEGGSYVRQPDGSLRKAETKE
jgi:hypothetical protein